MAEPPLADVLVPHHDLSTLAALPSRLLARFPGKSLIKRSVGKS
jgi:hypothetical protein